MSKMIDNEGLKNALAQKEMVEQTPSNVGAITPYRKIESTLKAMLPTIEQALPKVGLTPERLTRIALTSIRTNPALMDADFTSLISCIMQSAQLGLEPSILGHCYLIPFKDNKKGITNVQFQIGYRGYIELAYRGGVQNIKCGVVHENDVFEYHFGLDERLYHKPASSNRGKPTYYYAYAKMQNGFSFEVLSLEDIEKIRDSYSISYKYQKDNSIWSKHFDEMAKKTVLKRLVKTLPLSVSVQNQLASDSTIIKNMSEDPIHVDIFEGEIVDPQ